MANMKTVALIDAEARRLSQEMGDRLAERMQNILFELTRDIAMLRRRVDKLEEGVVTPPSDETKT